MSIITKLCALPGLYRGLSEQNIALDPIRQFQRWYKFAKRAGSYWPNSVCLSTATPDGKPSARLMLLKGCDERGFVIYTNYESRKARELEANPHAALTFHWVELIRQVRIEGRVERASAAESNAYFQSRPRGSRIGAWASQQSAVLGSRAEFEQTCREYDTKFKGGAVPLPPFWGGYRVVPEVVEFWQGRPFRLHDRFRYTRTDAGWKIERLAP
ncbi:MAG: pyridoxamine 5'-phosphate oxidase [Verrucomicrobia bacterium]|nr:MAG: pyridoxamine 5'-phosphate oxidase [Verrucomicrobiota bacterium]